MEKERNEAITTAMETVMGWTMGGRKRPSAMPKWTMNRKTLKIMTMKKLVEVMKATKRTALWRAKVWRQ